MTRRFVLLAGITVFSHGALHADPSDDDPVSLRADSHVYRAGVKEKPVRLAFTSHSKMSITIRSWWQVYDMNHHLIYPPSWTSNGTDVLNGGYPGPAGFSFSWDKRDKHGRYVRPGSYTIQVMYGRSPRVNSVASVTIALTPSGSLAGQDIFPLADDNQWLFRNTKRLSDRDIIPIPGQFWMTVNVPRTSPPPYRKGWFSVSNLVGGARYARLTGGSHPVLQAAPPAGGNVGGLFAFKRPIGYRHRANFAPYLPKPSAARTV
jgi:hypothetical protein